MLFRGSRGRADVEHAASLAPGAVFEIGSITKQFTAAGVLKLVEAGKKISLDDPLSKYLPTYPNGAHITLRELLNHTAGIKDYTEVASWASSAVDRDISTAQLIETFSGRNQNLHPGLIGNTTVRVTCCSVPSSNASPAWPGMRTSAMSCSSHSD